MTCYPMDAEYESGVRFIPVRRTAGRLWLHTLYVAESAAEALRQSQLADAMEHHPDWVADNELVGVAKVDLQIVGFVTPSAIERAEPAVSSHA